MITLYVKVAAFDASQIILTARLYDIYQQFSMIPIYKQLIFIPMEVMQPQSFCCCSCCCLFVFFFLSGFFFTNIHESLDCSGRGRAFLQLLTTTSTRFTDTQTLAGRLLSRAHLFSHSQQSDANREPFVSERNSLTTKLRTLKVR